MTYPYSAPIYDLLNSFKDYEAEANKVHEFVQKYRKCDGNNLLDVGCGTASHLPILQKHYSVQGLDVDSHMLSIAGQKFPNIKFHRQDMVNFKLDTKFHIITSLFSAVGYLKDVRQLNNTLQNMSNHLEDGGVIVIEPWYTPENFKLEPVYSTSIDEPALKISRVCKATVNGSESVIDCHYLLGLDGDVKHFTEQHKLKLFTHNEYLEAFKNCGLNVMYDEGGLSFQGFGLYIGVK